MTIWIGVLAALMVLAAAHAAVFQLFCAGSVREHERALKYRQGRFVGILGPGRHWDWHRGVELVKVDIRKRMVTVPGQEIITQDGVSVRVTLAAQFEIARPEVAYLIFDNVDQHLYAEMQSALRQVVTGMPVDALIESRAPLDERILALVKPLAETAGVTLHKLYVKDVTLPGTLKQLFAKVVDARKEGQADLERARGEAAAMRSMANTARMLRDQPGLYELRLLQVMGESKGNTYVLGNVQGLGGMGAGDAGKRVEVVDVEGTEK